MYSTVPHGGNNRVVPLKEGITGNNSEFRERGGGV